jgi:hypothetical protein
MVSDRGIIQQEMLRSNTIFVSDYELEAKYRVNI